MQSQNAQGSQGGITGGREGKFLALVEKMRQGMGNKQFLKMISCRECQGEVPVHCLTTRRVSEF